MIMIISSCSAQKDDSVIIEPSSRIISPSYYLDDQRYISELVETRGIVLSNPRAKIGVNRTLAYDLYIRAGNAYKLFRENYYDIVKSEMQRNSEIEWFFLSGGFGLIHALEESRSYAATFNRTIASQKRIPFTAPIWNNMLPILCDAVISKFRPGWTYVFGSNDYTSFIKRTSSWDKMKNIRMFESTGSAGVHWISSILGELMRSIIEGKTDEFNERHNRFVKQRKPL